MAGFYTGLASTADALLKDKGQTILVSRDNVTYDPITAQTTVTNTNSQSLNGAVFSKSASSYDTKLDEEKIKGETKSVLLSTVGSSFTPQINDKVSFNNQVWKIYGVSKLAPASTNVIYKIGVSFVGQLELALEYYLRPYVSSKYLRPDGTSNYLQPQLI